MWSWRHWRGKERTAVQQIYRCFLMIMVLTIQVCDLLNPLPSSDRRELAGWESGRRRSVTFIFSRPLGSPAKVIKERRAVHSGVVCISVCLCSCVLLGRESGERMLEDRYSWHFFQSPLCDPHLRVSERLVVGTESHGTQGGQVLRPTVCLWAN